MAPTPLDTPKSALNPPENGEPVGDSLPTAIFLD
jgi:hypothetical protein